MGRRIGPQLAALMLAVAVLAGCDGMDSRPASAAALERINDPTTLQRGKNLYLQHCATCHGTQREGADHWRQRNPDGTRPPPPLDGSAHTWHHPYWQLKDMIQFGSGARGGVMPGFEDSLSEGEVEAVIAWLQSHWPAEILEAWQRYDDNLPTQGAWEAATGEMWMTQPEAAD